MNPLTVGVGILFLLHWFEMIPWIKVSMALLPMRLVWAKALHLWEEGRVRWHGEPKDRWGM